MQALLADLAQPQSEGERKPGTGILNASEMSQRFHDADTEQKVRALFADLGFEFTNTSTLTGEQAEEAIYSGTDGAGNWIQVAIRAKDRQAPSTSISLKNQTPDGKFLEIRIAKEQSESKVEIMDRYNFRPPGTDTWKAPEQKPSVKPQLDRRTMMKIIFGGALATTFLRTGDKNRFAALTPDLNLKQRPTPEKYSPVGELAERYKLPPEQTKICEQLWGGIPAEGLEEIIRGPDPTDELTDKRVAEHREELPYGKQKYNNAFDSGWKESGLRTNDINAYLALLPNGFRQNITGFRFDPAKKEMRTDYGIQGDEAGHAEARNGYNRMVVITRSESLKDKYFTFAGVIPHEITHFNDFVRNQFLTRTQRLELALAAVARVSAPDRLRSEYVEEIKNPMGKFETYSKTVEYFAELGRIYFSKLSPSLSQADKDLMASVIQKTDPDFNLNEALRQREKVLERALA